MGGVQWVALRRAFRAAERLVGAGRMAAVLAAAATLATRRGLRPVANDLGAALRMVRETLAGRYRNTPRRTLLAVLAGAIYLVNPLDLLADVLPIVGLVDDVAVLAWVAHLIRRDLNDFLAWEREWGNAIDVEAAPLSTPSLPPPPETS